MYCVLCGANNPEYARYCRNCGKPTVAGTVASQSPEEPAGASAGLKDLSECCTQVLSGNGAAVPETVAPPLVFKAAEPVTTGNAVSVEELAVPCIAAPVIEDFREQCAPYSTDQPITAVLASAEESREYATLGDRFFAFILDLGIIYFAVVAFYFVLDVFRLAQGVPAADGSQAAVVFYLILPVYMISCLVIGHTTVGLYATGLEVRSEPHYGSSPYPSVWRAILRETIGRFVSSLLFYAGYWRVSNDQWGQAWLDKISHTVVVRRAVNSTVKRAFSAFAILAIFTVIGVIIYGQWSEEQSKRHAAWEAEASNYSSAVKQARETANNLISMQPQNLDAWKANMVRVNSALDSYDSSVDSLDGSLIRGQKENLFASEAERHQTEALLDILKLRKQQAEKQREEANLVIQFNPATDNGTDLQSNLRALDSDIDAIDQEASGKLKMAGLQ